MPLTAAEAFEIADEYTTVGFRRLTVRDQRRCASSPYVFLHLIYYLFRDLRRLYIRRGRRSRTSVVLLPTELTAH